MEAYPGDPGSQSALIVQQKRIQRSCTYERHGQIEIVLYCDDSLQGEAPSVIGGGG